MTTSQRGGLKRKYGFPDEDAVYSSSSPSSHSEWDSDEDSPQTDSVDFGHFGSFSSSHHMPSESRIVTVHFSIDANQQLSPPVCLNTHKEVSCYLTTALLCSAHDKKRNRQLFITRCCAQSP